MTPIDRYRALIEARIDARVYAREGWPGHPGQYYLRSARLHVTGGAIVYSRAAIVDFFAESGADHASSTEASEAPEVIAVPRPGATLLAARYRPATVLSTCLSLAVMRGDWISEEWLFGPEPAENVPEQVDPKRIDMFSVCPIPSVEQPLESMPGAASAQRPLAAALDGFHRSCNLSRDDALDSIYARDASLDLADGETGPHHQSAADFHAALWRRFSDPVLHAEQVVAPAEDAGAAVLWHLTGRAPDTQRRLHLRGLSFWRFDAAGRITADWTRFDTAAMQREREADAAAWRA